MLAHLLEGKPLAEKLKIDLQGQVAALRKKVSVPLALASIQIEDNSAAQLYTSAQKRVAQELGITYQPHLLPKAISEKKLCEFIEGLNRDTSVHGIIVQLPVPKHIDYTRVVGCIAVNKDVEGMHPANIGKIVLGQANIIPCTAAAVMELLAATGLSLYGKEVVIVGHSQIVGKPLSLLLLEKLATVTVCHIATSHAGHLEEHVKKAEVLIVAVGKHQLIKGKDIKKDAVVIDVGINRVEGKIVGDVEFDAAAARASWITPVPGGVGPLTVVMLMRNLITAVKLQL